VQVKINRARHIDHPPGRHSIRTNQCPPTPSPNFFQARCPSCRQSNSVKALKATLNIPDNLIIQCVICQQGDGVSNTIDQNCREDVAGSLPNPNVLVVIRKGMWAVKLCSNKTLNSVTEGCWQNSCCNSVYIFLLLEFVPQHICSSLMELMLDILAIHALVLN